jgi:uncharacterized membrane protein YciS (DUF1049 family)
VQATRDILFEKRLNANPGFHFADISTSSNPQTMRQRRRQQAVQLNESQQDLQSARKDAFSALIVWIFLEALSLMIQASFSNSFQLIQGSNKLSTWLSITIPSGIIGAVLIGISSWWVKWTQEKIDRQVANKQLYVTLSQSIGWLGLLGIGLPIIVVGVELLLAMMRGPK